VAPPENAVRNEIVDMDLIRKEAKAKDNRDIDAVSLLKILIRDIERGEIKVDSLLILATENKDNLQWRTSMYRSNLTRERECALLSIALYKHMDDWRA
jgi:hypothetical protein